MTWYDILSAPSCSYCTRALPRPDHGLRRAFCPTCTAGLPHVLMLHLDRAIRSDWYIAWWRIAMREQRREEVRRELSRERGGSVAGRGTAAIGIVARGGG